jgi:hypothetical protein
MPKAVVHKTNIKSVKLKIGKGVTAKDGKTPFAAGTLFYSSVRDGMTWKSQMDYTMENIMKAMASETITEIQLIDKDNNEFILSIER